MSSDPFALRSSSPGSFIAQEAPVSLGRVRNARVFCKQLLKVNITQEDLLAEKTSSNGRTVASPGRNGQNLHAACNWLAQEGFAAKTTKSTLFSGWPKSPFESLFRSRPSRPFAPAPESRPVSSATKLFLNVCPAGFLWSASGGAFGSWSCLCVDFRAV